MMDYIIYKNKKEERKLSDLTLIPLDTSVSPLSATWTTRRTPGVNWKIPGGHLNITEDTFYINHGLVRPMVTPPVQVILYHDV